MGFSRVWLGSALPAPDGAGLDVGDVFVVVAPAPSTWGLQADPLGLRSWAQLDGGGGVAVQVPGSVGLVVTPGAPASRTVVLSGSVLDTNGLPMAGACVRLILAGDTGNASSITPTVGALVAGTVVSSVCTEIGMVTDAAGAYSVTVLWSVSEPGTQGAWCGWYAPTQDSVAYP